MQIMRTLTNTLYNIPFRPSDRLPQSPHHALMFLALFNLNSNLNNRYPSSCTSRVVLQTMLCSRTFRPLASVPESVYIRHCPVQYTQGSSEIIRLIRSLPCVRISSATRIQPTSIAGQCRHVRCRDLWTSGSSRTNTAGERGRERNDGRSRVGWLTRGTLISTRV